MRGIVEDDVEADGRAVALAQMQTILDSARDGIFLLDARGRVAHLNRRIAQTQGSMAGDATFQVGSPFVEMARRLVEHEPGAVAAVECAIDDVIAGRRARAEHDVCLDSDAGLQWLNIRVVASRHLDGAVVTVRNVTAAKLAEVALVEAKESAEAALAELARTKDLLVQAENLQSIGSLAAGVAHEINTPIQYIGDNVAYVRELAADLGSVLAAADAAITAAVDAGCGTGVDAYRQARQHLDLDEVLVEVPAALADAADGVAHVAGIVSALKEFAHPGGEERVPTDLNALVETSVTVARGEWRHVADVELDLGEGLGAVDVAPGPLGQVLLNLVVNAAHAIEDAGDGRGSIHIATRRCRALDAGDRVRIEVRDSGCGMPEEVRRRVWDPFFTTKGVGRGTGQGLAIAWRVVTEIHAGTIDVASVEGSGTTFTIELPVEDA